MFDLDVIEEAINDYQGYCVKCKDFTNYGVEPDAENYTCECCDNDSVMGTEQAILLGYIE